MKLNFKLSLKPPFIIHDVSESAFIYGSLNGQVARKHKKNGNVQFILWYAGTQGHTEDYWHNFDKSWWELFEHSH
jgi:hypothetical protein